MAGQYGEFVINLRRDNLSTAWGFRLQGGKEFSTYLSIQRVFNGSPADGHLQRGDVIVAVDNEDVSYWHQKQAYDLIQSIGLTLALVVRRGGSDLDARPAPTSQQAQPVASFVRKPFGQQQQQQQQQAQSQHHQHQQQQQPPYALQQQLSPQMTSKATLNFQPAPPSSSQQPYASAPSHFSTDRENIGPSSSSVAPWAQQQQQQHSPVPHQNSFSTPFQVRSVQPPQKAYSSYSPQQSDSFASGKAAQPYTGGQYPQGTSSPAAYPQDQSGGRVPFAQDSYQRDAAQSSQQPSYNEESNHVTYDRNQSAAGSAAAHDNRNEPVYNEGRKEGGGGGGEGEEEEDYQALSVRDIKQMFNKPDQKDVRAGPVSRIKSSPVAWTRPPAETSSGGYGASGPRSGQPPQSSLSPIRPGSVQRCPAVSDDFRKSYSPPARPNYGQPRFTSPPSLGKPTAVANVNKQGGAYAGIIQPSLPPKTTPAAGKPGQKGAPQKKKDFDPNQSAVYKILLEEEERAKNQPQQAEEEEEEEGPRRQAQGPKQGPRKGPPQGQRQPQKQQSGASRLNELLERDAAQLAPYKEEERRQQEQREQEQRSAYQEQRAPYQEQRSPYQDSRAPHQEQRSAYQESRAPHQEQRSAYQEPRAPYQEQRSPYQEPRAPTYQAAGSPQPYRNEVHQPRSPARGAPAGGWQGASSAPYGSQDYASSFPQTQLVDGIPTSDF